MLVLKSPRKGSNTHYNNTKGMKFIKSYSGLPRSYKREWELFITSCGIWQRIHYELHRSSKSSIKITVDFPKVLVHWALLNINCDPTTNSLSIL